MFWVGIVIALVGGLAGIGLSREAAKERFPRVRDFHLDWVAIAFLVLGLLISALDYRSTSRQLASLEVATHRIQSFAVDIDVQFTADWKEKAPQSPRVMVMGPSHVAEIDLALDSGDVRSVKLFMDKEPSFGPTEDGQVHTTFRLRAEPGSWPIASDSRSLREVKRLAFIAYGVRLADSKEGVFTIGGNARLLINGTEAAVMNQPAKLIDLKRLSLGEKSPEMSFNGTYPIRVGGMDAVAG
jgi:hypothetical protein